MLIILFDIIKSIIYNFDMIVKIFNNGSYDWNQYSSYHKINNENFKYYYKIDPHFNVKFIAIENDLGLLIGLAQIMDSVEDLDANVCNFISIHEEYRGQGISKLIIKTIYEICKKENKSLRIRDYSDDGFKRLRKSLLIGSEKYKVELREGGLKIKDLTSTYQKAI